jgi:hypothetical protein
VGIRVYGMVYDVDGTVKKTEKNGGKVLHPPVIFPTSVGSLYLWTVKVIPWASGSRECRDKEFLSSHRMYDFSSFLDDLK